MKSIAMIHRRLSEGKTYDDYRKAWLHAGGFGAPTTMYNHLPVPSYTWQVFKG